MAIAWDSGNQPAVSRIGSGTSTTIAFGSAVAAGSVIVVFVFGADAGGAAEYAVRDNVNGPYTPCNAISYLGGLARGQAFYRQNTLAGTPTVTIGASKTTAMTATAHVVTGPREVAFDAQVTEEDASSTTPSVNLTTVAATTAILGAISHATPTDTTITAGGAYTIMVEEEDADSGLVPIHTEWARVTAAGSTAVDWTFGVARAGIMLAVSFKEFQEGVPAAWLKG